MASHHFIYPKVVPVKETSAHRKTKIHPVVPKAVDTKAERPRRAQA